VCVCVSSAGTSATSVLTRRSYTALTISKQLGLARNAGGGAHSHPLTPTNNTHTEVHTQGDVLLGLQEESLREITLQTRIYIWCF